MTNRESLLRLIDARRASINDLASELELDSVLLVSENTRHWLGFGRSPVVLGAAGQVAGASWAVAAEGVAESTKRPRIGFDADLTLKRARDIDPEQRAIWIPINKPVAQLRAVKDALELTLMQRAARLTVTVVESVLSETDVDVSENDLLHRITAQLRDQLGDIVWAFDPSIGVQERTTIAWAGVTNRRTQNGPVLVDVGIRVGGYCSDISRSAWIGSRTGDKYKDWRRLQSACHETLEQCIPLVAAGEPVSHVAERCEELMAKSGLQGAMRHLLGHGLGLGAHESPSIAKESPETFEDGMVVSLEPGGVLDDVGYRFEHPYLVAPGGAVDLLEVQPNV